MNVVNIEQISKIYGEKTVFDHASFGIQQGDKIGIVGINGTGKSTLLKMIAGEEEPDEGQIVCQNGLRIAYLPQNPPFPEGMTLSEYIGEDETEQSEPAGNGRVRDETGAAVRRPEEKGGSGKGAGCGI